LQRSSQTAATADSTIPVKIDRVFYCFFEWLIYSREIINARMVGASVKKTPGGCFQRSSQTAAPADSTIPVKIDRVFYCFFEWLIYSREIFIARMVGASVKKTPGGCFQRSSQTAAPADSTIPVKIDRVFYCFVK